MHNSRAAWRRLKEYLPENLTVGEAAAPLGVTRQTVSALLQCAGGRERRQAPKTSAARLRLSCRVRRAQLAAVTGVGGRRVQEIALNTARETVAYPAQRFPLSEPNAHPGHRRVGARPKHRVQRPSMRPSSRRSPSRIVYGCGGHPGTNRSTGTV